MKRVIINNNGNTGHDLIEEAKHARDKLEEAIQALCAVTCHGRNYQLNEDPKGDMRKDDKEQTDFVCNMIQAKKWLLEGALHVQKQLDKK